LFNILSSRVLRAVVQQANATVFQPEKIIAKNIGLEKRRPEPAPVCPREPNASRSGLATITSL
jgi:hypothetical protein